MKKTVDEVVLLLALREFISGCDADVLSQVEPYLTSLL